MARLWQDYVEPGDELEAGSPMKRSSRNLENDDEPVLPLPENVLTRNLGLHVIVVVTKVCSMGTLPGTQPVVGENCSCSALYWPNFII